MGILGLSKLIADIAPQAVKECEIKNYFGIYYKYILSNLIYFCYNKILCNFQAER